MDSTHAKPPHKSHYHWSLTAQFIALFALIGVFFQASIAPLFARWIKWDEDLSHAIPTLIAFLLLILRSQALPYRQNSPLVRAIFIAGTLLLSLCWLLFVIANITLLANIALLSGIVFLVAACYSFNTARFLAPFLGILWFTLPLFAEANNLLVAMSAGAVGFLVKLVGITALIDGQSIYIPSGHIYIADGCSGLRYFTIAIFLGYTLSILNNYRLKQALLALLIAASLGLLTNWLRIFALVIIGDVTDMKSSLMHDHEFFGWVLFSGVMFPAIYFAPIKPPQATPINAPAPLKPLLPLLAFLLGPLVLSIMPNSTPTSAHLSLGLLAPSTQVRPSNASLNLQTPSGQREEFAQIELKGVSAQLQLTHYQATSAKEKIMPYFESLYNTEEWRTLNNQAPSALAERGFAMRILLNARTADYQLLIYRFEIGRYNANNYQTAKLLQIPATLLNARYAHFFSVNGDCAEAQCADTIAALMPLAVKWDEQTKSLR